VKNKKYWFETQYEPSTYEDRASRRKYGYKGKVVGDGYRNELPNRSAEEFAQKNCPDFRNKRAVWKITTKPFREAHFAVFPEELCETPIKAGCPEFVCKKCGKSREKIIEREGLSSADYMRGQDKSKWMSEQGQKENMRAPREAFERKVIDKGLTNCNCNAGFSGGIVLDPFFGAGTTGLVALKQKKQFIGIELNPSYIEIANKRLKPYLEQEKL